MILPSLPHHWRLGPRRAAELQCILAQRVVVTKPDRELQLVAGLDAAFSPDGAVCIGAAVVWDCKAGTILETATALRPVRFPYVPGLLSFREAPALLAALRKLQTVPDVLLCDGQGLAHPRRFGLACHVGVLCDLPAIGCAKSRLIGDYLAPGQEAGSTSALCVANSVVGTVVRTKRGVRPVFVSVGHKMDLESAVQLVLACVRQSRIPEPTRLADHLVARTKARL